MSKFTRNRRISAVVIRSGVVLGVLGWSFAIVCWFIGIWHGDHRWGGTGFLSLLAGVGLFGLSGLVSMALDPE